MEATAVSVGKAVLDGALGYAKSKVAKEIVLQLGVERDFVFITDELQMMQSFLMTADEEQSQNKVLMTWVKQTGDLAYNVEDSLMDFSLHSDKKPFWGCIPRSPCDRRRIAKEVKELRAKVEDVSCRNLRYRLINENSGSKPVVAEEQANIASAAMFGINEARIAALEKEKSEVDLYQLIASNNVDLKVIAVWGTAGDLGKTTAIQEVYDNPKVVSNFGFRAWVRLTHPFNPKEFLHSTVRQFYETSPGKLGDSRKWKTIGSKILMNMEDMTQSNITNEFDTQVNCSRYLIVIDNLSTISEWNCIKRFFPDNKKRSRIIISTQQAELASLCTEQPYQVSELKQLSSDQTLYVFHKNNSEEQVSMAEAGVAMLDINEPKLSTAHKEKLKVSLRQLISDGVKDLRVIVVKETCGDLGNLSVIKEVYDDPTVNANFGLCAWVTLTRPFNPKEFIQILIRQFKSSADELEDAEEITSFRDNNVLIKMEKRKPRDLDCLFDAQVRDNSYLFVINDVSTVEEWDCVKKYFLDYKKGSRIIVSTHQVEIASLCTEQTYQVLEMKQLSSDQILCTFHNKVTHESCSAESISDTNKVTTTEKNNAIPTSEMQEDQQPESASEDKVCNSTARKKFYRNRTLALADEMFTGRKTEKSFVIKLVCQPEQNEGCKVISVWGMGGLGKTTLVRSVYRSQELSSFKRAWATAMRPFNPEVLLRDITLQLQKSIQEDPAGATTTGAQTKSIGAMQLFELKEELSRLLNTQKCLIVLDDISSTFEWDLVNRSLGSAGIIIVTTREKNIAEHCSREYKNMYSLQGLKEDAALELFKKKVFKDSTEKYDFVPVMMEQARLILKKCHGLPLAISTIGGFLATKPKTAIEWRKMNDRISAELEINPELRSIKTVLMRSYDGLPFHLKFAFLYLSIFRECRIIRRNRLVKRWIAEGYSRERHGMTASEVGGNYFDELLDRSMILPAEGVDYFNEKIDACQLHDIIHEICISKAREENLVFTLEEGGVSSTQGAIRHLVIGSNWKRDKDVLESMLDLSHVRSLTVFGEWEPFFISDNMRYLRVVDLEGTLGLRDHHLDKIGQLLHLKYLSLRGCRNIYYLPNSLGNLRHLQTLDVRGTRIFELPTTITKLRKLQHLRTTGDCLKTRDSLMGEHDIIGKYASRVTKSASSYALMVQTGPLFWRPQVLDDGLNRHDIWNIYRFVTVCLEEKGTIYGWLEGFEAPRGIGKLKALHTLDLVNVARGKGKAILKELEGLTQLYKLGVAGISNENSKQFWSTIASHNQLRSLSVQGYPWRELDGCLGEDLSPPNFLRSLKLYGELVRLTKWIHQLQNLSKLILAYTHLEQDDAIHALGVLPNLAILRLMWGSFVGNQLHFQGPCFPNLMVLELNGLTDVKSVFFEDHSMPRLELLQADWCWSLKEISGLPLLTSLEGVRLGYQVSQELKEQVQSQVAEHKKLVSLDTNYVSSFSME